MRIIGENTLSSFYVCKHSHQFGIRCDPQYMEKSVVSNQEPSAKLLLLLYVTCATEAKNHPNGTWGWVGSWEKSYPHFDKAIIPANQIKSWSTLILSFALKSERSPKLPCLDPRNVTFLSKGLCFFRFVHFRITFGSSYNHRCITTGITFSLSLWKELEYQQLHTNSRDLAWTQDLTCLCQQKGSLTIHQNDSTCSKIGTSQTLHERISPSYCGTFLLLQCPKGSSELTCLQLQLFDTWI